MTQTRSLATKVNNYTNRRRSLSAWIRSPARAQNVEGLVNSVQRYLNYYKCIHPTDGKQDQSTESTRLSPPVYNIRRVAPSRSSFTKGTHLVIVVAVID